MDNEKEVVNLIGNQIKDLAFNNGITDQSTFDINLLKQIRIKLNNTFVDEKIIEEEIWIEAYEALSKNYKQEEYRGCFKLEQLPKVSIPFLANKIEARLRRLPEKYEFLFPLPKSDVPVTSFKFTDNIEILSITDEEYKRYYEDTESEVRKSLADLLKRNKQPLFSKGTVVIRITGIGYVSKFGLLRIVNVEDPSYIYKVILGTYIATSMLKRNNNVAYFPLKSEYRYGIYHSNEKVAFREMNLSTEDADYIFRMNFDTSKFTQSDIDSLLKAPPIFERTNKLLAGILQKTKGGGKDVVSRNQRSVKNGAFWLYEAIKTNEEHNRTIYATTAYDALVGSRSLNEEGKGRDRDKEYKADLISQAVGKNIYETNIIKQGIMSLFAYRNEIVHGEKPIYTTDKYEGENYGTTALCVKYLLRYFTNRLYFVGGSLPNHSAKAEN